MIQGGRRGEDYSRLSFRSVFFADCDRKLAEVVSGEKGGGDSELDFQ